MYMPESASRGVLYVVTDIKSNSSDGRALLVAIPFALCLFSLLGLRLIIGGYDEYHIAQQETAPKTHNEFLTYDHL
jgi:hypothetical protein